MIATFNRFDGRSMVFNVDGAGVLGEYRVTVADRFYLDGSPEEAADLAEHVRTAGAGLVYELVHRSGGRFADVPKSRDNRALSEYDAEFVARMETKAIENPKARELARAARVAALTGK